MNSKHCKYAGKKHIKQKTNFLSGIWKKKPKMNTFQLTTSTVCDKTKLVDIYNSNL